MTSKLVLLRHGQSEWNKANLFTGWWDADLSEQGRAEAEAAGPALADAGVLPTPRDIPTSPRGLEGGNMTSEMFRFRRVYWGGENRVGR